MSKFEDIVKREIGDCALQVMQHAKVTSIDRLGDLPGLVGSPVICGENINIIIARIRDAYQAAMTDPEPDGLDLIGFPQELVKHLPSLRANGITDSGTLSKAGIVGLTKITGIGDKTAAALLAHIPDKES